MHADHDAYRGRAASRGSLMSWGMGSSSSSSFGSMAVHSLGVLPPPTVYLAHMGDESVLLYIYTKKKKKKKKCCNAPSISEDQSPSLSWRCVFSSSFRTGLLNLLDGQKHGGWDLVLSTIKVAAFLKKKICYMSVENWVEMHECWNHRL